MNELSTFSFQAPGFYAGRGYQTVLDSRSCTDGIVKFTLHKQLGRHATAS